MCCLKTRPASLCQRLKLKAELTRLLRKEARKTFEETEPARSSELAGMDKKCLSLLHDLAEALPADAAFAFGKPDLPGSADEIG